MSDWTELLQATVGIDHITPDSAREPFQAIGQEWSKNEKQDHPSERADVWRIIS